MCEWQSVLTSWLGPGESMLAYQAPGAYLVRGGPMDTNIIWLGQFGPANQETVDWMERTGRWPDVVVAHPASAAVWKPGSGDPLTARLVADYGAPVETGSYLVLRRDGAKEPPWPAPERSCMK